MFKYFLILQFILLLPICKSSDTTFTIYHTGDMHSHFAPDSKGHGGMTKVIAYIKALKANSSDPYIFLDAGDIFTGTIWFSIHRIRIAAEFVKLLKPDVQCVGNHEFDEGVESLGRYLDAANLTLVCANGDYSKEPALAGHIVPSKVLQVAGVKVAVIGYMNKDTATLSPTGKVVFEEESDAIQREITKLKREGVKIFIGLGHSGYAIDQKIASKVDDLDIIVGGHTHTFLYSGQAPVPKRPEGDYPTVIKNNKGRKVPIVHAYAFAKFIGKFTVTFDNNGVLKDFSGNPIMLEKTMENDPEAEKLLEHFRPGIDALQSQVIGKSRVYLNGSCRILECNFGNLVTDAFVDYKTLNYRGNYWTDTPIALLNGGAIRQSITPRHDGGEITLADLYGSIPFDNLLVILDLSGETLLKAIEFSVASDGNTSRGEFLQYSGIHVVFDLQKEPYNRALSVKVRCAECDIPKYEPLNKSSVYKVAVNHYLANGGDGYNMIRDEARSMTSEPITDLDILKQYVKYYQVLQPRLEERIIVKNDNRIMYFTNNNNRITHDLFTLLDILLISFYLLL